MRINRITWQFRTRLIVAYFSLFAAIGFSFFIPFLFGNAIDSMVIVTEEKKIIGKDFATNTLVWFAVALLAASIARGFFDFARTYMTDSLSQFVAYDLRNRFYDKLQHLSFAYHDREHTGDLMSKATADVEAIRRYVNMGLVRSLEVFVRIIGLVAILSYINWELTLISLAFVPFVVVRSTLVMGRLRRMWLQVQQKMGETVTILQENLVGIHVVKAFASEDFEKRKYARQAAELREEYFESERLQGTNSAWMTMYFTTALGLILWYGGWEVIRGDLTAGEFTMFILFLNQLTFPVRMSAFIINSFSRAISSGIRLFEVLDAESPVLERANARDLARATMFILFLNQLTFPVRMSAFIINSFSRAISSGIRLFEVLDAESPVLERANARDLARADGGVKFDNVSFGYDGRDTALRNVTMTAEKNQITAILGAPGSGKSTIVNLLPRFYEVTEGRITIDDLDIRDLTLQSLRRNVGIVQQDVFLFSATIKDNIAYGIANATFEDIVRAAKVAQLHDHIVSLPDGYDTWVGERGTTLSGGQRQRLSIARSILIDPPVLILDDSTSSVDVETERQIHQAMVEVMRGRTTFVIAHRLSTVQQADHIVVLDKGRVAEQGTHGQLYANAGIYRNIFDLQLRPQEELMLDVSLATEVGGDC